MSAPRDEALDALAVELNREPWEPDWAVHPGDLLGEVLEDQGLSRRVAARTLGWPVEWLDQVLDSKHNITEVMARDLESIFGLTARVWMNMQARWDQHRLDATEQAGSARP